MDEIWFRLSTQLESLQVHTAMAAHQSQQWITARLTQGQEFFQDLHSDEHIQQVNHIVESILIWLEKGWQQFQLQYDRTYYNCRLLYRQFTNLCTKEVSKKDVLFLVTGIAVGTLIGFYIGINWKQYAHHMHHIKAITCHHYIGTEAVSLSYDLEMPMIQNSNELLIQVKAASVNVIDTKITNGYSQFYRRLLNSGRHKYLPVILGRDCAGVVVDIGQKVINFDIGDEVFLAVPSWAAGTMAEFIVVPETMVARRPKNFTFEASASLPYNGCLAWDALVNKSVIEEGNARKKRVLIFGGSTPVGCILIQLVKQWGGHVVAACTTHATPVTRALGADEIISLGESNLEKELHLHEKFHAIFYTGGYQVDEFVLRNHLLPSGSYVSTVPEPLMSDSLGFVFGSIFAGYVRTKLLVQYMLGLNTFIWRDGSKINATYLQALCDLAETGQLQTVLDSVYAPHNIEQALNRILDLNALGSVIIKFQ